MIIYMSIYIEVCDCWFKLSCIVINVVCANIGQRSVKCNHCLIHKSNPRHVTYKVEVIIMQVGYWYKCHYVYVSRSTRKMPLACFLLFMLNLKSLF